MTAARTTLLTVKENQSTLHAQLDSLPWHQTPCPHYRERGHGRTEQRTTAVLPPGGYPGFPHISFPSFPPLRARS